jgi:hypothetical protein
MWAVLVQELYVNMYSLGILADTVFDVRIGGAHVDNDHNGGDVDFPKGSGCSNGDQRSLGAYESSMQPRLVQPTRSRGQPK